MTRNPFDVDAFADLSAETSLVVPPEFMDENDHMNIQHYLMLSANSIKHRYSRFALDADVSMTAQNFFTLEQHLEHFDECRRGDRLSLYVRFTATSDKALHSSAYVVNDSRGAVSCAYDSLMVFMDLAARKPIPYPAPMRSALESAVAQDRAGFPDDTRPTCISIRT